MSYRHWCAAIVVGLIVFGTLGQAQEIEDRQRGASQKENAVQPTLPPLRIQIVEDQADAQRPFRNPAKTSLHGSPGTPKPAEIGYHVI
ncbi:hypothetical protein VQ044_25405, partial [Aurantimonas sp. C2-5-R2]|uniref:hypothetical protein n=1 Tax=Aurantimonas sp. C2-5-R2 TaxID=3113713 RepID=UPI002F92FBB8